MHLIRTVLLNFETPRRYELKFQNMFLVYAYILVSFFFKMVKRLIEPFFGFHTYCTFYLSSVVEMMWRLPKCNI